MNNWTPGRLAWKQFCEANPGLALNGNNHSFVWFVRTYGEQLRKARHLRKTVNRRWLANSETFNEAAFDLLSNGSGYEEGGK